MPITDIPRTRLAFPALDIETEFLRTHTTAIWTNHLPTTSLAILGALQKCRTFATVRKHLCDLQHSFLCFLQIIRVVLVRIERRDGSLVGAACPTTNGTIYI